MANQCSWKKMMIDQKPLTLNKTFVHMLTDFVLYEALETLDLKMIES